MNNRNIFILTGAGVSAESGLGTFRDAAGLWTQVDVAAVASIEGYLADPQRVLDFYNTRRANLGAALPNSAHYALARLEAEWAARGGCVTVCTQNIDNLHERAGSRNVVHMHGELSKTRCHDCGDVREAEGALFVAMGCEQCGRIGGLRPHVVWFGEAPLEMDSLYAALAEADLFIAVGTSGAVYPAAGFVAFANEVGAETMEINLAPSDNAGLFGHARYGAASEALPAFVEEFLANSG